MHIYIIHMNALIFNGDVYSRLLRGVLSNSIANKPIIDEVPRECHT